MSTTINCDACLEKAKRYTFVESWQYMVETRAKFYSVRSQMSKYICLG